MLVSSRLIQAALHVAVRQTRDERRLVSSESSGASSIVGPVIEGGFVGHLAHANTSAVVETDRGARQLARLEFEPERTRTCQPESGSTTLWPIIRPPSSVRAVDPFLCVNSLHSIVPEVGTHTVTQKTVPMFSKFALLV